MEDNNTITSITEQNNSDSEIVNLEIVDQEQQNETAVLEEVAVEQNNTYIFSKEEEEYIPKLIDVFSQYENYVYTGLVSLKLLIDSENYQNIKKNQESITNDEIYEQVIGLPETMQELLNFITIDFDKIVENHINNSKNLELQNTTQDIEQIPGISDTQSLISEAENEQKQNNTPPSMRPMPDQPE